jgi:zinc-ribbon domain
VICPNCREDNAPNFRFCGMCGTSLELRRPLGAPALDPLSAFPPPVPPVSPSRTANTPAPLRPVVVEDASRIADKPVPPIAGPSMLGLTQPAANPHSTDRSTPHEPDLRQPSTDLLRERSFSGLDSFLEPEQPKTGGRRILLMLVLLVALGSAGWWTYTNYLGATEGRKPEPAASSAGDTSAEKESTKPSTQDAAPAPAGGSSGAVAPSAEVPESSSENASAGPDTTRKALDAGAKPAAEAKPAIPVAVTPAQTRSTDRREAQRVPGVASVVTSSKISKSPPPAATDIGDADFRKGEAYLYGRGGRENCDEAVKNLKAASAKSNAKARSAFGTMYATGHCVPRDLPTSYLWFALALRVDPNNQILEKDLNAVWNQMTPPERQMATRMKQ